MYLTSTEKKPRYKRDNSPHKSSTNAARAVCNTCAQLPGNERTTPVRTVPAADISRQGLSHTPNRN
jgi:hypothetical protein